MTHRLLAALAVALTAGQAMADPLRPGATIAFLGIHFIDTSTEGQVNGVREDEILRMDMLRAYVAEDVAGRGFDLVDITPVLPDLDRVVNVADCNYCDVFMGRKLGAEYTLVGEVQKVSNLILSMNLVVRETAEGQFVKGMSVDIRGNNDNSWKRGARYILKNNIFRAE